MVKLVKLKSFILGGALLALSGFIIPTSAHGNPFQKDWPFFRLLSGR